MPLISTNRACSLLFILFLCLFLSLWLFQMYFIPSIIPITLRFLALLFRSYFCFGGPFNYISLYESLLQLVPTGSPSRGGDVTVYVPDINQPSLLTPFLFCSCVCLCLYVPFNCISFLIFFRQLSAFSPCSSNLVLPYWSFELWQFLIVSKDAGEPRGIRWGVSGFIRLNLTRFQTPVIH